MPADFVRDRAAMEKHIQGGGSVMLPDGRNVTRVEDLPDESLLAGQDVERHQAEVDRLQVAHDDSKTKLDAAQKKLAAAQKNQPAAPAPKANAGNVGPQSKGDGKDK